VDEVRSGIGRPRAVVAERCYPGHDELGKPLSDGVGVEPESIEVALWRGVEQHVGGRKQRL
jgi:hypothetical protein